MIIPVTNEDIKNIERYNSEFKHDLFLTTYLIQHNLPQYDDYITRTIKSYCKRNLYIDYCVGFTTKSFSVDFDKKIIEAE